MPGKPFVSWDRVQSLAGLADASVRHDEYLYGKGVVGYAGCVC